MRILAPLSDSSSVLSEWLMAGSHMTYILTKFTLATHFSHTHHGYNSEDPLGCFRSSSLIKFCLVLSSPALMHLRWMPPDAWGWTLRQRMRYSSASLCLHLHLNKSQPLSGIYNTAIRIQMCNTQLQREAPWNTASSQRSKGHSVQWSLPGSNS